MSTSPGEANVANILVVDDTPVNLRVLVDMLRGRGYIPRPVPSGKLALQAAQNDPPDLILLDITMPDMDGYEVCRRLKADERLRGIPVIFISALTETMDKVKAFSVGGVDYVTKPFQFAEVQARVETHLAMRRQQWELQASHQKLQELEALRDNLVHMIVHDMRTPLTAIKGFLELLEVRTGQKLSDAERSYVQRARGSTENLIDMVSSLLDVSKMEAGEMTLDRSEIELVSVVRNVLARAESLKGNRRLTLEAPETPVTLAADAGLILRVVQNLVGNALKFTPDGAKIQVGVAPGDEAVRVFVRDNGPGIPLQYHQKIFEKFGQVAVRAEQRKYSTGLGLTFCKLAVEAHGGRIGVDSDVGMGSTFWFTLPRVV